MAAVANTGKEAEALRRKADQSDKEDANGNGKDAFTDTDTLVVFRNRRQRGKTVAVKIGSDALALKNDKHNSDDGKSLQESRPGKAEPFGEVSDKRGVFAQKSGDDGAKCHTAGGAGKNDRHDATVSAIVDRGEQRAFAVGVVFCGKLRGCAQLGEYDADIMLGDRHTAAAFFEHIVDKSGKLLLNIGALL